MSFKFVNAIDLFTFVEQVKAAHSISDLKIAAGIFTTGFATSYWGIRQTMMFRCDIVGGSQPNWICANPVTLDADDATFTPGAGSNSGHFVTDASDFGQPNLTYFFDTDTDPAVDWDVSTMTPGSVAVNWLAEMQQGAATAATPGGYGVYSLPHNAYWLIFRGLTDGVPGGLWTPGNKVGGTSLVGPNVYPGGLALVRISPARLLNNEVVDRAFCWVDIANAQVAGVAYPTLAGEATATAGIFREQPFKGVTFPWNANQFIPDPDCSAAAPKGEMMAISDQNGGAGYTIPGSAFTRAVIIRFVDFNPMGVSAQNGSPTRVHGRISLTNAIEYNITPIFDVPGAATASSDGGTKRPFFDRSSRRLCMLGAESAGGTTNVAGAAIMGYWSRQLQPVNITAPVSIDIPRTNDIVDYECFVTDSLNLAVGGVRVNWSLARNSTEDELLTISGGIGTTSTVANGPIDTTGGGVVTLSITANGTPLVLTTDYTVVALTGVITWVTSQVGLTVLATYEHRATNATPAHGTLLTQQSTTGEDGRAFAQIRYLDDDDLVGCLDRITAVFV